MFNNLFVPDRKIGEILPPFSTQTEKIATYAQQIDREWVEGSAISPDLFRANVTITASESIDHGGDVARPLHDALNWKIDRWQGPIYLDTASIENNTMLLFSIREPIKLFSFQEKTIGRYLR